MLVIVTSLRAYFDSHLKISYCLQRRKKTSSKMRRGGLKKTFFSFNIFTNFISDIFKI